MATEAELRIRPRLVGDATADLSSARADMRKLGQVQERELRQGRRQVNRLEQAYDGLRGGVGRVRRGLGGVVDRIFSIQSAVVGTLAFGAGRTFLEATLGSADDMRASRRQLKFIFDDANAAVERSKALTREVASLSMEGAISGMKTLGVAADGSVEDAAELVKIGKVLETMQPEQGFEGAAMALRELSSGETRSLVERFELPRQIFPSRDEARRIAKEQGMTFQQVFIGRLKKFIEEERGGVETLLQIDRESLRGNVKMLTTAGQDLLRTVGEHALPEVTDSVEQAAGHLRALQDDPEFREAAKEFGQFMGDAAESLADMTPMLIRAIPRAARTITSTLRSAKDFYDAHPTLVKVAAGLFAANSLTGGGLTSLGGSLLGRLGGGGMLGSVAGGAMGGKCCEGMSDAADTLDDVATGAKGAGGRSFLQKTLFSAGSSTAAASFTESTLAAMTPSALGSVAAAAAPFALGALGLSSFASAKGDPTETTTNPLQSSDMVTNAIQRELTKGNFAGAKTSIISALGGDPNQRFTGSRSQQMMLDSVRSRLETFGLDLQLQRGQRFRDLKFRQAGGIGHFLGTFGGLADTELSDISNLTGAQAVEGLNRAGVTIQGGMTVQVNGVDDPAAVEKAARRGTKKGLEEGARQQRALN